MIISQYDSIYNTKDTDIELSFFLEGVRTGKWQDIVLQVRATKDKDERDKKKKSAPLVTVSGSFSARKDEALRAGIVIFMYNQKKAMPTMEVMYQEYGISMAAADVGGQTWVRFAPHIYNTPKEIDTALQAMKQIFTA